MERAFHFPNIANSIKTSFGEFRFCKYIWVYKKDKSNYYLANLLNHAVILVDENEYLFFKNIQTGQQIQSLYQMNSIKMLVADRFMLLQEDELEEETLKRRFNVCQNESQNFGITIGLTMNCNFACSYCYQYSDMQSLSETTIRKINKFFLKRIATINKFVVCWFGGEPLLQVKIIESMSNFFINHCENHNVDYIATLITNGYLLNAKTATLLRSLKISSVQITLDGTETLHNKTRHLKSGDGTFSEIITNLRDIAQIIPSIRVRVNISDQNLFELEKLLDILSEISANTSGNISVYFMPVHDYSLTQPLQKDSLHVRNYYHWQKTIQRLEKYASSKGLDALTTRHRSGLPYCNAYSRNCIVVDPNGGCYYCVANIGIPERRFGFLDDDGRITPITDKNYSFERSPFQDAQCMECSILPLCMGGCPKFSLANSDINGRCFNKELFAINFPIAIEKSVKDPVGSSI